MKDIISENTKVILHVSCFVYEKTPILEEHTNNWFIVDQTNKKETVRFQLETNMFQTFESKSVYDAVFKQETIRMHIVPIKQLATFLVSETELDTKKNVLHVSLTNEKNPSYVFPENYQELVDKTYKEMQALVQTRDKKESLSLQLQYKTFSFIKKIFGGKKLKRKHHIL